MGIVNERAVPKSPELYGKEGLYILVIERTFAEEPSPDEGNLMPATKNQDVMDMVRKELDENPEMETDALFDKAKAMDSSLEDLSLRQFHARYPLQVKRQRSASKKKAAKNSGKKSGGRRKASREKRKASSGGRSAQGSDGREAIRAGLLRFAKDVAAAENKADLITVLTSVDDYVDEVSEALEKG